MKFFVTFTQKSPFKDGWLEVEASSKESATLMVMEEFGNKWGFIYERSKFESEYFPAGKLGEIIEGGYKGDVCE